MSREELKHRMDQMTPPDFNQEDLWGKIESEKKKKWGFAWFFMAFGLGLVAIVATWTMSGSFGSQELELVSSQENALYENQESKECIGYKRGSCWCRRT